MGEERRINDDGWTVEVPMSLVLELDETDEEEAVQLGCMIAEKIAHEAEIPVQPAGLFVERETTETRDPSESRGLAHLRPDGSSD